MKRPEITEEDVIAAVMGTLKRVERPNSDPPKWIGIGLDGRARLLEYIGVPIPDADGLLVIHCMRATKKSLKEVGLEGDRHG